MATTQSNNTLPSQLDLIISKYSLGTIKEVHVAYGMVADNPKYIIITDLGKFVLKNRCDEEALKHEIAVLNHLKLKKSIAEEIVRTKDGKSYVQERGEFYLVAKFIEGKHPQYGIDELTVEMTKEAGRALASIHIALKDFDLSVYMRKKASVFSIDEIPTIKKRIAAFKALLNKKNRENFTESDALFLKKYTLIQEQFEILRKKFTPEIYAQLPHSIINGDYHPYNLFFEGSQAVGVIDWEGCYYGPRIFDLTHHYFLLLPQHRDHLLDYTLVDAYQEVLQNGHDALTETEILYLPEALRFRLLQSIYARLLMLFEYGVDERKVYAKFGDQLMLLEMLGTLKGKPKKKYLFLTVTEGFAGAEHFQMNYFKFIDYKQYSVTLGLENDVFSKYLEKEKLPISIIKLPNFDVQDKFFDRFLKYYRFFQLNKPDCVVFNQYWLKSFGLPEIFAAFLVTKGNACMIVHDCPPVPQNLKQRILQALLGYFTKFTLAVSKACRHVLIHSFHFPRWNVKLIYHGIDTHKYIVSTKNRDRMRRELNIPSSDYVIVSTAMLWPVKRIDHLLKAFNKLAQEREDIHLIITGTGSEHDSLMHLQDSFEEKIQERIYFLGYREDIPQILELSDIYVLPSDSEGLPLACLEAMACGLITIVTNCGGPTEIIKDGCNGFLVEKSWEGVLDGLKKALNLNIADKKEMSLNARKTVEDNFNLEKNIQLGLKAFQLTT